MTITVIFEGKAKATTIEKVKIKLRRWLVDTRKYKGCEQLTTVINQDDPLMIVMIERWQTRQHYKNYLQWREETGVLAEFFDALTAPPRIQFFDDTNI